MPTVSCYIDRSKIDKFTKQQRAINQRLTLRDEGCPGLKLVINNSSSSWVYTYRKRGYLDGGKRHPQRAMKLGDPILMTPSEARTKAELIKAQVRDGLDPALEQRQQTALKRAAEARQKTCSEWLEIYTHNELNGGGSKHERDETRHVRLSLEEMGASHLRPDCIDTKHIRSLLERHHLAPATNRHRFGALSRFLEYLIDEEVIHTNPTSLIAKKRRPKPPPPRMSYYTPEQLKRLWQCESLKPEYLRYLRFMITTPLRADEGATLTWSQVIYPQSEIRLSHTDTKNSAHFVMPVTPLAFDILGHSKAPQEFRVFQLTRIPDARMQSWSHFNKKVRKASGVEEFTLHDLRRTFSTLMAEHSEVSVDVIDGLLNHKQSETRGGVIKHYQHAKLLDKRRDAMQTWASLLEGWLWVPNNSNAR
jgi:integrase